MAGGVLEWVGRTLVLIKLALFLGLSGCLRVHRFLTGVREWIKETCSALGGGYSRRIDQWWGPGLWSISRNAAIIVVRAQGRLIGHRGVTGRCT